MRAASTAAFFALSMPTVATGTPGGICTIESSASRPSRTLIEERSGTPITGSSVCAATTPGSAAARPAPQISTRRPRPAAERAYSATASGSRWAERTSNSLAIPRASSSSSAACILSRSDSDPTRMPTRVSSTGDRRDVAPEAHAFEAHPLDCLICLSPRLLEFGSDRGHGQDTAAVRHEPSVAHRRPALEDEGAVGFGLCDPVDRGAGVVASLRVLGARENDGDGSVAAFTKRLDCASTRRGREGIEEIALEPRQQGLRLRIAEPGVELEHANAVVRQHQAGEEAADERRATAAQFVHHRLMDARDELVRRFEPRHGRVRAHASGVGTEVAVSRPLEVLCRADWHG